jgi:ABC-type bacteriocin/lantibiotic exporter with double-glycine peptidase domain
LLGFEQPESGSIYYDRQDLAGLDLQAVRRQIGAALHDGKLTPGSIWEKIIGTSAWRGASRICRFLFADLARRQLAD